MQNRVLLHDVEEHEQAEAGEEVRRTMEEDPRAVRGAKPPRRQQNASAASKSGIAIASSSACALARSSSSRLKT